jgi:hypothetical protein
LEKWSAHIRIIAIQVHEIESLSLYGKPILNVYCSSPEQDSRCGFDVEATADDDSSPQGHRQCPENSPICDRIFRWRRIAS